MLHNRDGYKDAKGSHTINGVLEELKQHVNLFHKDHRHTNQGGKDSSPLLIVPFKVEQCTCDHEQIVNDQKIIADTDEEQQGYVDYAVEDVPSVPEDSEDLFVEVRLVWSVVNYKQTAGGVLNHAHDHQR